MTSRVRDRALLPGGHLASDRVFGGHMLRAYGVTDKGLVRSTNEDCFGIDPHLQLCVVADGMGGHNAGEVAARLAVETIIGFVGGAEVTTTWPFGFDETMSETGNLLRTAVHVANARIHDVSRSSSQYAGMGTTIVAAMLRGNRLSVAHVGDSRVYLYARRDGQHAGDAALRLLTRDDSWMASMLAANPAADRALLQQHPMRHALTHVAGAHPTVRVHTSEETLSGGEIIALTTDGVHGVLEDDGIARLLADRPGEDAASGLVAAALAGGSRDNCTAIVAEYAARL